MHVRICKYVHMICVWCVYHKLNGIQCIIENEVLRIYKDDDHPFTVVIYTVQNIISLLCGRGTIAYNVLLC